MRFIAQLQQTGSVLYQLQDMNALRVQSIAPIFSGEAGDRAAAETLVLAHYRSLGLKVSAGDFEFSLAPEDERHLPPQEGPTPISLDVFLAQARATIDAFETQWREGHAAVPEQWPMQMWPGDWWEQLSAHDTSNA